MYNQRGFISFRMITLLLALVGAWFLWGAYKEGRLVSSIKTVVSDYSEAVQGRGGGYGRLPSNDGIVSGTIDKLKELVGIR